MINLGGTIPPNYISGLVEYDNNRIFNEPNINYDESLEGLIDSIRDEVCSEPSPAPTTDPTIDPTSDPTRDPTADPTTDPTRDPTADPTTDPTRDPTTDPTKDPTSDPTADPTSDPTADPTNDPTTDPTADPTSDPTADPTTDPTSDPTKDPTADPTSDPTADPTTDPTSDPTTDPTQQPTSSPTRENCDLAEMMIDLVIAVDASCGMTETECRAQQELIAETFTAIRGDELREQISGVDYFRVRVAYTEFGSDGQAIFNEINFFTAPSDGFGGANTGKDVLGQQNLINLNDINMQFYQYIIDRGDVICTEPELSQRNGNPNLSGAIDKAFELWDDGKSLNNQYDRELLIFSNCAANDRDAVCEDYEDDIRNDFGNPDGRDVGVNVNMINTVPCIEPTGDDNMVSPETYLACLVEYDPDDRIFVNEYPGCNPSSTTTTTTTTSTCDKMLDECNFDEGALEETRYSCDGDTLVTEIWEGESTGCGVSPTSSDRTPDDPCCKSPKDTTTQTPGEPFDPEIITKITESVCTEPTPAPTTDPTNDPTTDPTRDPTTDPTADPTSDPTTDPSTDPTSDPTSNPTQKPTISPIVGVCQEFTSDPFRSLDVILIVDNSADLGNNTVKECQRQQEFISEIISSFKGAETVDADNDNLPQTRVGYYVFGTEGTPSGLLNGGTFEQLISLTDTDLNSFPLTMGEYLAGLYYRIRDMDCGDAPGQTTTNLYDALEDAIAHFGDAQSDANGRDKKIIIVSNRANTAGDICADFEQELKPNNGIDIVMINIPTERTPITDPESNTPFNGFNVDNGNGYYEPDLYNLCLVNNDPSRIIGLERNRVLRDDVTKTDLLDRIQLEICSDPSPSPTTDPTTDPTKTPTSDPTAEPSSDPTESPTRSPIVCDCGAGYNMDLVLLIDLSCIPDAECDDYTEGIAELFSAIKGEFALPRVAVETFDGYQTNTIVSLNDSNYNNFYARSGYRIGLDGKVSFYNDIKDIECNGNSGNSADKSTNVISAIESAFDQFDYEEKIYLPSISSYRSDYTGRDKKIVIFSTCTNTGGSTYDEAAVCNAYSSEASRTIDGSEVEITIFNAWTSSSNIMNPLEYLMCLTEDDRGRQYYAGGGSRRGGITLDAMTQRIDCFKREICNEPSPAPTTDPTPSPTKSPTSDPTDVPTDEPTTDPTRRPTSPPIPRCTCDNLGWKLRFDGDDCYGSCYGCMPYGPCDYRPNCYTYTIVERKPNQCKTDCKSYDYEQYRWVPHKPSYIIISPRGDCPVKMERFEYWNVVQKVTCNYGYNLEWQELYDSAPDPMCDNTPGIKVPIRQFYNMQFTFKLCLYGVTNFVEQQRIRIGWGYNIAPSGYDYTGIKYGYSCPSRVKIPDLCEDRVAYGRTADNIKPIEDDNNDIDLLKPGSNNKNSDPNNDNSPKNTIFALYSSYSLWVFIAITSIFLLNVIVCTYIKCIRGKNNENMKSYGSVSNKGDESDASDGTDSELDSDSDDIEKLIE